jgi:DNA-binding HxlR family transcriptional regulator
MPRFRRGSNIPLSEIGESLRPVIDTLKAWGEGHQERLSCAPVSDAEKVSDHAA